MGVGDMGERGLPFFFEGWDYGGGGATAGRPRVARTVEGKRGGRDYGDGGRGGISRVMRSCAISVSGKISRASRRSSAGPVSPRGE